MKINPHIFRGYDLRGLVDNDLNSEIVEHLGKAYGTYMKRNGIKKAVVGFDCRATSEEYADALIKGFSWAGIDTINIGMNLVGTFYWAQYYLKAKGGTFVTASHNPVGWNGVKLGSDLSYTLLTDDLQEVYNIIAKEDYVNGKGTIKKENILEAYMKDLLSRTKITKKFKILINTGNGTAGIVEPEIFRRAGCEVIEHFTNIDPTYPNYTANPDGTAMMEDTGEQTVANECDLGFAFDGDGDRLGLVDEKGQTIWPDRYIILLGRLVLSKEPGAKIIFDVKVSEALPEDIRAHGGTPIMWKTGHSHIKAKMLEEKAAMAGEMSGHVFFKQDFYGFDDATFAALKLLEYLSAQEESLSGVIATTPYYVSTPTIQVKATDEDKYEVTEEFKKDNYKVIDINGARVYTRNGWGLVRASSNTPTLVLRFEAKTQEDLEKIQKIFKDKLDKFPVVSKEWDSSGH